MRFIRKERNLKTKKPELDVDYVGGQEPLTKEQEAALSAYIRSCRQKEKLRMKKNKKELV